ncbi:MAG: hypothetical protein ABIP77_07090 [Candidatus Limnocylindrales bacterium]
MTAPRDADDLIRAFLDEGQAELPDRAFDAVRRDIHRTRQRVVIGPWRQPALATVARAPMAAAVVLAIGVAWVNLGPSRSGVGGLTPTPTATPAPTPSPSPPLISGGNVALEPGRHRFDYGLAAGSDGVPGPSMFITIADLGWTNYGTFAVDRNYGSAAGASLVMWRISNRYVNGCSDLTDFSPAPGPGIDELLQTLADQPGIKAGPIRDVRSTAMPAGPSI